MKHFFLWDKLPYLKGVKGALPKQYFMPRPSVMILKSHSHYHTNSPRESASPTGKGDPQCLSKATVTLAIMGKGIS